MKNQHARCEVCGRRAKLKPLQEGKKLCIKHYNMEKLKDAKLRKMSGGTN